MRLSFVTLLSVPFNVCLVSGLQLAGAISASSSHHHSYIDHKVRQSTSITLNHGLYHRRNVVEFLNTSINAVAWSALPATIPLSFLRVSLNISTARHSSLPNVLPSIKAAETDGSDAEDWSKLVDGACSETLALLDGRALSASGIATCYNVRAFDKVTGAFDADLRLYRLAAPLGDWMRLSGSIDVGVEYRDAGVTAGGGRIGNGNGDAVTIEMPVVQRDEAKDVWRRRAGSIMPRMLGDLTLAGILDGNITIEGISEITTRDFLTPNITLSGIALDGTAVSTNLSLEEASFVTGLFAIPRASNETAASSELAAAGFKADYVLPGTIMVGFPTGLIITSVWSLLLLAVEGYGIWKKLKARKDYRRRVKQRLGGGGDKTSRR